MNAVLKQSATEWCYYRRDYVPDNMYQSLRAAGYGAVELLDESRWAHAKAASLTILNMGSPGMADGLNRVENHSLLVPEIRRLITKAGYSGYWGQEFCCGDDALEQYAKACALFNSYL